MLGRSYPLALSSDGKQLAYVATDGAESRLHVRSVDEFDAAVLDGSEGARNPFSSPDGERIGFFAEGELRKLPSGGGAVLKICDAPLDNLGSAWREDGMIVFASYASGLWRVVADGGDQEVLTRVDAESGEIQHRWPQFLPGNRVLMAFGTTRGARVAVVDLRDGKKSLVAGLSDLISPNGGSAAVTVGSAMGLDDATAAASFSPDARGGARAHLRLARRQGRNPAPRVL